MINGVEVIRTYIYRDTQIVGVIFGLIMLFAGLVMIWVCAQLDCSTCEKYKISKRYKFIGHIIFVLITIYCQLSFLVIYWSACHSTYKVYVCNVTRSAGYLEFSSKYKVIKHDKNIYTVCRKNDNGGNQQ
jgi:glucan phosphoethanolaminetransferase (alkaline phosphatase superfamily)